MTNEIVHTTKWLYFTLAYEGETEHGVAVVVLIPRIAVKNGQDTAQFEAELEEQKPPSTDTLVFPLRMIL
jgi:hypothetical protein